jgi:hypothetical protein
MESLYWHIPALSLISFVNAALLYWWERNYPEAVKIGVIGFFMLCVLHLIFGG